MIVSDEPAFLTRWSQRKAASRQADVPPAEQEKLDASPPEPAPEAVEAQPELPLLPDPATLDADSDFRPFMARGVPAELRRDALRQLWRVNPIINSLDGLDDYYVTQNFTDAATVVPDLRTVYRIGKGMLDAVGRQNDAEPLPAPPASDPKPAIASAPREAIADEEAAMHGAAPKASTEPA